MFANGRVTGRVTGILLAGAMLATGLSGCASIKDHRGYLVDGPLLDSIQLGVDNRTSVEKTLGRPSFVSQFGRQDWYYVSTNTRQSAFSAPHAKDNLLIHIVFDGNGNVTAVERTGMEKVAQISPDGEKTPTLGRNRGFLEDLFGNIGQVGAGGKGAGAEPGGPNGS